MAAKIRALNLFMAIIMATGLVFTASPPGFVQADSTAQALPFSQAWTNTGLITANDDWSGVPGIIGYLGDYTTSSPANVDPQTILNEGATTIDVIANQTDVSITNGGVAEFQITDPVVAMQGSGTADAPYILVNLTTTDMMNINISYNVRDIDTTADNAVQQVALHYRVGNTGSWTNVPAGYIADATIQSATKVTPISVTLPSNVNNQSLVQIRFMTTNATGSDEWVGIDDISITGTGLDVAPTVDSTDPANGATNVAIDTIITVNFSEAVTLTGTWATLVCGVSEISVTFGGSGTSYTITPDDDLPNGVTCTGTVLKDQVADQDIPIDNMAADYVWTFNTIAADAPPFVSSTVPTSNATEVEVDADLSVTFSESVTGVDSVGAVSLSCTYSGLHSASIATTDNTTYTITPAVPFAPSETCTVTLESTLIFDSFPQNMSADYILSFKTDTDAITPIGVARAAGNGWIGTIQGNLTIEPHLFATRDSFYIQDGTGGIYIFPSSSYVAPAMVLGDEVKVKGTVKLYGGLPGGLLEIDPVTSVSLEGPGTVPAPEVTATNAVAATQGKLIQVEGTIRLPTTPPAPGAAHYTLYINDGSGEVIVYVYKLTNIDMRSFADGQHMRIVGISTAFGTTPEIQPRYQFDIIDLRPPTVTGTDPTDTAIDVSPHKPISVTFNKDMAPGSFTGNFTITGVTGSVSYDDATHKATFTPATILAPNTTYTANLNTSVTDSYGIALASAYTWSFTTGDLDVTPPSIVTRSPLPGALDVAAGTEVSVTFDEELAPGSLDLDHFFLNGPFGVVPAAFDYDPVTFTVTLTPSVSLLYSTDYTMTVTADTSDYAGNPLGVDDVWTFTTMAEPPMQTYFGDIHNHTSYSDGSGTPSQALAAGEAAGFDFMAITDHSYAIDDSEWGNILTAVEAATDADFVALRGFEYTQGAEGHINVYNSTRHATRTNVAGCTFCDFTPNLEAGSTVQGFYPWLVSAVNTPLDAAGEVMQFNHPGWINFNDWFYHPEVSGIARLEEVGNGSGSSYVFSEEEFIRSLDYGWKVGATNNADTHSTEWGTNTEDRTGVVMPGLTKTALLEALRQRRTFATEDMNFSLSMKANGAWMGSEIANTGTIQFLITGEDADSELATLVELKSDQGEVLASTTPSSSTFTWEPALTITTGVHYYYVKVTQADGERIVSSPVWTMGGEDIAITDLTIQPTIPTTNNASLLTVRVTNRVVTESRDVNIILSINDGSLDQTQSVTVPANGDGYVNFSWQPLITGPVTITATIETAPTGDNPDDNSASLYLDVTDELLPLILIDAGHGNMNAAGNDMKPFINDLSAHGYNVLKNLNTLEAADLNNTVVKLLMITAPETAYTADELTAIGNYVNAGGSLWIGGLADYNASLTWAATVADRENAILDAVATATGQTINMRMNDDEVIDGNTNNGYVFGVTWQDFPSAATTGIGMNVESVSTWSLSSIVDGSHGALTAADTGVSIVMQGDLDEGWTTDYYHNPFHTGNTDYDGMGDAYIYNPTWVYPTTNPGGSVPLPGAAVVQLGSGAGRIMLYGDSNDPFTIFAYTAGDGKQNELFNLESVMWLLGEQLEKSTIFEARAQAVEDVPDNLGKEVWIEGEITAAYGEFFNVLYVQDATGGITVHAPAGDINASTFTRGTHVRVIGTVDIYAGDTELQFFEAEQVQVIAGDGYNATPLSLTTAQASLESNEGWLTVVTGTVISKSGPDTIFVDDGSGLVRVFLDGYNGTLEDIHVNDQVQVTGLVSEDGSGGRIRVRNYNFHGGVPDDIIITFEAPDITALELLGSLNSTDWTTVFGNLDDGYILPLDPELAFQFLDAGTYTVNKTLADGYYGFYLDTASVPADFYTYWAAKFVYEGCGGTWEPTMWQIINGDLPMFYLKVAGAEYSLIDGMTYLLGGGDTFLQVSGDYPLGTYDFSGAVADTFAVLGYEDVSITFEALPDITALELLGSLNNADWVSVSGNIDDGYTLPLDPGLPFEYLDAGTYTVNKTLADGYYGFYLDTASVPAGFYEYWDAKNVNASSSGWQAVMWQIIIGNQPMFFLKVEAGEYSLIDGMTKIYTDVDATLRVSGDYPLATYDFSGTVEDIHAGLGTEDVSITFVSQSTPTLSVTNSPVTYDGTEQAATVEGSVPGTVSDVKYDDSSEIPVNAGTYAITADFIPVDTLNYETLDGASAGDFVINQATPTLSVTNPPVIYDGSAQAADVVGSVPGAVSDVKYNGSSEIPVNAGTYAITADFAPDDAINYESLSDESAGDYVIGQATPTLSVTNSPVAYDGTAKTAYVEGSVDGTVSDVKYDGSSDLPVDVGTYAITADFAPDDATNYESLDDADAGDFVIGSSTPTLLVTNSPATYDGTAKTADVEGSVPGTVSDVKYDGSSDLPVDAGTYAITADFAPDDTDSYESLSDASAGDFVISQATPILSVTNSPVTYDGTAQAANVEGSVPGTVSDVRYNGSSVVPTAAGTYAITTDFAPEDATNYESLSDASAGNFVIAKRAITVTADAQSKLKGAADPELTYQITSGSLISGDVFTGGLTRVTGEDPGIYAIEQGNLRLSANYELTFIGANLTINDLLHIYLPWIVRE